MSILDATDLATLMGAWLTLKGFNVPVNKRVPGSIELTQAWQGMAMSAGINLRHYPTPVIGGLPPALQLDFTHTVYEGSAVQTADRAQHDKENLVQLNHRKDWLADRIRESRAMALITDSINRALHEEGSRRAIGPGSPHISPDERMRVLEKYKRMKSRDSTRPALSNSPKRVGPQERLSDPFSTISNGRIVDTP